jgi:Domain of unknown function (DUF4417)
MQMTRRDDLLPPEEIPALPDPCFDNQLGPYSHSDLKQVVGTRINPDSIGWYKHRELLLSERCPAKTCAHPELEGWLGDVGSFDARVRINQPPASQWPMSKIIPRMALWGESLPFEIEPGTYMIDYLSLNSDPTSTPTRDWVPRLRERFPEGSRLILSFFGPEGARGRRPLIIGLWTLRDFWYAPFLDQFDGVVLPDFSAYSDDPLPQMLFGERQAQIFAQEGSDAGRTIIPAIAWCTEASLRRQVELYTSQPNVNTILMDCYGSHIQKVGWAWRWLFAIEKYCAGKDHIRWMFTGLASGWVIRELNRIFPNGNYALVTTASPQIAATRGTTDKEIMAKRFRRAIGKLEDFHSGRMVADPEVRPETWPTFGELLSMSESNS